MQAIVAFFEKFFGASGKVQLALTVMGYILVFILGVIVGMAFAKPTIVINKKSQHVQNNGQALQNGGEGYKVPIQEDGSVSSGLRNRTQGKDSQYWEKLLQFLPPSPSI